MSCPGTRWSRLAAAAFEAMPSEAAVLDATGIIVLVNETWRDFGRRNGADEATCGVGRNYLDACQRAADSGDVVAAAAYAAVAAVLNGDTDATRLDYPCHSPSQQRWYQLRCQSLPGQHRALVLHDDITWRTLEVEALRHDATHDPLTGLANRALLNRRLETALAGGDQHDDPRVAVMVLDLDGFKKFNDTYGHPIGDAVLIAVADRLRALIRTGDTVARWGGDEFVIVLANGGPAGVRRFRRRLAAALSRPVESAAGSLLVGASIGVALSRPGHTPTQLLAAADEAARAEKAVHHQLAIRPDS